MDAELSIADIDGDISLAQDTLSLYPRSHSEHIACVHNLAEARWARYQLSQEKEDLDKCLVHCTEAILLPPVSQAGHSSNVARLLFNLGSTLLIRYVKFEQPEQENIKYSLEYLRYFRGLALDFFDISRKYVTELLILALGIQVVSQAEERSQNIEEMVVLCSELLTFNMSTGFPVVAFQSLNRAVHAEFDRGLPIQSLDKVIECLRHAVKICPPGSHRVLYVLASTLFIRFAESYSNDDYEEAVTLVERILDPNQPGGCPNSIQDDALILATELAYARSVIFENPEYYEVTISRLRALLRSPSIPEGSRLQFTNLLANQIRKRFTQYSLAESLEQANSYTSQLVDLSSSQSLEEYGGLSPVPEATLESCSVTRMVEKIQHLEELLSVIPPGTKRHTECLDCLVDWYESKFLRTNDISDIEESIKYTRLLLDATYYASDQRRAIPLCSLHDFLFLMFKKTSQISYLDESITVGYDILALKSAQHFHFHATQALVRSLLTREHLLGGIEGVQEAIKLISMVIDNQYVQEPDRFNLCCDWAIIARCISHPTTSTAYKTAMSLMQKSLSFAPTVSIQHTRLVTMGKYCQRVPLDYASFQIYLGRFEEAVETLEQGRTLLWSEMRGFRTPIRQLIAEELPLAKRFTEINQELEMLTVSVTPSGRPEMEDGMAQGTDWTDPFGRLVIKRRKLVDERDALISQIKGRPGLEGFLKAPSFTSLRSVASRGPIILINHCQWRSDILIIFHNSFPCSIPTADDFWDRANKLREMLMDARKVGLDSAKYQHALRTVLRELYELVGQPVIARLRLSGVPEQSRVWWCPTSVFCSLPLHAMGPIPLDHIPKPSKPSKRYFSDLYIPSYTPSLSALIESRNPSAQVLDQPSLLLVAQPDASLPGVWGEIEAMYKINVPVKSLILKGATSSSVLEGLLSHRFAHFACHGNLETGMPFDSSFQLYDGDRLTLLDIVRSRLPNAEFAFLSCCHAAEITEQSVADEALHLTAAMQYCGFRSVVGTMWAMADTDGRDLAENFYKSLFSSGEQDVPYYERSARALRNAARKLRRKEGMTLERWVNFVHYGA